MKNNLGNVSNLIRNMAKHTRNARLIRTPGSLARSKATDISKPEACTFVELKVCSVSSFVSRDLSVSTFGFEAGKQQVGGVQIKGSFQVHFSFQKRDR